MDTLMSMMRSTLTALQANQAALDVTASNVANQHTVGYTREVVRWQTGDSVTLGINIAEGVNIGIGAISQRDRVLEQRVQQQTQTKAQSDAVNSAMQQVQNIFSLRSTATSASTTALGAALDKFWGAMSALASNPSNAAMRQDALTSAAGLTSAFNSAANQMLAITASLNQQVETSVVKVNSLTSTIAHLNAEIMSLGSSSDAGALEDQRQAAIADLSSYIGVTQISTENNGITLTTATGQAVVSGAISYTLGTAPVSGTVHVFAATGQDLTTSIIGGQIGGVIDARDTKLPVVMSALDTLASAIATNVNSQNALGLDGNGVAGLALFTVSAGVSGPAGSLAVATTDPRKIATAALGEGDAGNGNALALAQLSSGAIVGGTTTTSFYAALLNHVGNTTTTATADAGREQVALIQITKQRDSLSGVSLDQEAANLTQYQRSYEAAARVFAMVNTMMATALNLGERTTVS